MSPDHRHPPDEEARIREAALDDTVEGTFPASDPPATLPNPDNDEWLPKARRGGGEHEGATERQVGDTTGPGAGLDLDSPAAPGGRGRRVTSSR
jgi:hypothetical protein